MLKSANVERKGLGVTKVKNYKRLKLPSLNFLLNLLIDFTFIYPYTLPWKAAGIINNASRVICFSKDNVVKKFFLL